MNNKKKIEFLMLNIMFFLLYSNKMNPIKKLDEIHFQITKNNVKINEQLKKTFNDILKYDLIINNKCCHNKLIECFYNDKLECKYETSEFTNLILIINLICEIEIFNKYIIENINEDFDFLISSIKINKNIIKKINNLNNNEEFYLKLVRFLDLQTLANIFKIIPENMKTYSLCKIVLTNEYGLIKYIDNQTEDICNIALTMGHDKLEDINIKNHTHNICKKYVNANINNLIYITHKSNLTESFFFDYINQNPENLNLINIFYKTPKINRLAVSKCGKCIKYVPPNCQSTSIIELACIQNPNSIYYITYDLIQPNKNIYYDSIINSIIDIKKIYNNININDVLVMLKEKKIIISFDSGILINESVNGVNFFAMTAENFINYENIEKLENNYECDFSIFVENVQKNIKTNSKKTKTQFLTKFNDNDNIIIVFFECF